MRRRGSEMRKVTLRSLWDHKRRLVSTVISVLLGVAFMCGTLVFTDTIERRLRRPLRPDERGDRRACPGRCGRRRAVRRPATSAPPSTPRSCDTVREVDGVAAARAVRRHRQLQLEAARHRRRRRRLEPGPADAHPVVGRRRRRSTPTTSPTGSRPPEADDEVAINVAAAEDGGFEVGDTVPIYTQDGHRRVRAGRHLPLRHRPEQRRVPSRSPSRSTPRPAPRRDPRGRINNVFARGDDDVSSEQLTARIAEVIPGDAEALTGEDYGDQTAEEVTAGFSFFTQILVIFAGIALLVGIVHHLQHLPDPPGPAHAGAGAASGDRRQPRPGAAARCSSRPS